MSIPTRRSHHTGSKNPYTPPRRLTRNHCANSDGWGLEIIIFERFKDKKTKSGGYQAAKEYLVKWTNWTAPEWIQERQFIDCELIKRRYDNHIREFERWCTKHDQDAIQDLLESVIQCSLVHKRFLPAMRTLLEKRQHGDKIRNLEKYFIYNLYMYLIHFLLFDIKTLEIMSSEAYQDERYIQEDYKLLMEYSFDLMTIKSTSGNKKDFSS